MDGTIVVEIIGNYLSLFKDYVEKHIKEAEKANQLTFLYILTVPAMWDARAKELMTQAAIHGGLVKNNQRQNMLMITEPEAAALSCEMSYKYHNKGATANFIVCDAGGGTVDLVTFRLEKDDNENDVIFQLGDGEGDTCGSTYIDDEFKEYLVNFYRPVGLDMPNNSADFNQPMKTFINELKPKFEPYDGNDSHVIVNLGRPIPSGYDKKGQVINGKRLKIRRKDMQEKIFDPTIDRVEELIKTQIGKLEKGKIDVIILVGGFSKNSYLRQRLTRTFLPIKIVIPDNAVTSISEGAVSYALKPRMIIT
ncbi:hypothetical protein BDF21DRAFT_15111 [Thamnidium elegans]|nr:hypothetical protein BDF21DRAFT_15111 [Thamnidium elegans]